MKITNRQLRRIIREEVLREGNSTDPRALDIEDLIYVGEYELADSNLQALGQDLPFLRGHNPAKAEEMEKEYDRLSDLLSNVRRKYEDH
jgi:hypothetical protein